MALHLPDRIRGMFSSNLGFLMAALGSVLGLGSIWRFPYVVYTNGGGAFLIPFAVALLTAGLPVMILEYGLGHRERGSAPLAFAKLHRRTEWLGWWMPIFVMFGIMFYYQVIIGWCLNFVAFSWNLGWGPDTQDFFINRFLQVSRAPSDWGGFRWPIVAATALVWLVTWFITYREIHRGIEKACGLFMPVLVATTGILVGWGLTLPGAWEGVAYYLVPQWDKLLDIKVWMAAYSQTFFTLSLAFGIMIAYASYLPRKADLVQNAAITCLGDTVYSLFAGLAVFSVLGYLSQAKGLPIEQIVKTGPALTFVVFPEAISRLPFFREGFGILFFSALAIAGLATGVSIIESMTSAVTDKFNVSRKAVVSGLCLAGFLGSLVFTAGSGLYWLDICDHFLNQYGLVLAGLLECVFVGHFLRLRDLRRHINDGTRYPLRRGWELMIKYLTPLVLLGMLVRSLASEWQKSYGGYSTAALLAIGASWLLATLAAAAILSLYPWTATRLQSEHKPESDEIFL